MLAQRQAEAESRELRESKTRQVWPHTSCTIHTFHTATHSFDWQAKAEAVREGAKDRKEKAPAKIPLKIRWKSANQAATVDGGVMAGGLFNAELGTSPSPFSSSAGAMWLAGGEMTSEGGAGGTPWSPGMGLDSLSTGGGGGGGGTTARHRQRPPSAPASRAGAALNAGRASPSPLPFPPLPRAHPAAPVPYLDLAIALVPPPDELPRPALGVKSAPRASAGSSSGGGPRRTPAAAVALPLPQTLPPPPPIFHTVEGCGCRQCRLPRWWGRGDRRGDPRGDTLVAGGTPAAVNHGR